MTFWEERQDAARASLHRDGADHERAGAALERRWAELDAADGSDAALEREEHELARLGEEERTDWTSAADSRERLADERDGAAWDRERVERQRQGREREQAAVRRAGTASLRDARHPG